MATTEILLLKQVKSLGSEGEHVRVKAGYARNFLFPNELAVPMTRANKKQIEALQKAKAVRERRDLEQAELLARQLSGVSLAIVVKTGENGRMFGAVTVKEISEHLAQNGIAIDRKKIHLQAPIKEVGRHRISILLHPTISLDLHLDVVSENPIG
ncbi:MAG: 50S ribosomal protein L9 [Puniceicoccales bacterium]|jgi:large subunit ribosomal protein L9|nr:50S ribosomal protein L9 [Puniceicoccales bacterium]